MSNWILSFQFDVMKLGWESTWWKKWQKPWQMNGIQFDRPCAAKPAGSGLGINLNSIHLVHLVLLLNLELKWNGDVYFVWINLVPRPHSPLLAVGDLGTRFFYGSAWLLWTFSAWLLCLEVKGSPTEQKSSLLLPRLITSNGSFRGQQANPYITCDQVNISAFLFSLCGYSRDRKRD